MPATVMKTVAIVAAYFVPSNFAGVHRARLWSLHLREFGWDPVIVTTHWKHYEESLDWELFNAFPSDIQVIRTTAIPTLPVRLIGDIGLRAFPWHYKALASLARDRKIDFIHITIPSFYSACLGRLIQARFRVPYGIDYIDPWVHYPPGSEVRWSKKWATARLAELLEPWAVRDAALITGITKGYYDGMLARNPLVARDAVQAEMPYGASQGDHEVAERSDRPAEKLAPHPGKFNLVYAGAMLPNGYALFESLFAAIAALQTRRPNLVKEFHLHFIGTGARANDPQSYTVRPRIERYRLEDCVSEYPARMAYFDVLNHLHKASGVLVIGSTEPHYSPSKIFQAILSKRPVIAMMHYQSAAFDVLERSQAGSAIRFDPAAVPNPEVLSHQLEDFIFADRYEPDRVNWEAIENYTARASAAALAKALDEAIKPRNR